MSETQDRVARLSDLKEHGGACHYIPGTDETLFALSSSVSGSIGKTTTYFEVFNFRAPANGSYKFNVTLKNGSSYERTLTVNVTGVSVVGSNTVSIGSKNIAKSNSAEISGEVFIFGGMSVNVSVKLNSTLANDETFTVTAATVQGSRVTG